MKVKRQVKGHAAKEGADLGIWESETDLLISKYGILPLA